MNATKAQAAARARRFDAELAAVLDVPVVALAGPNERARSLRSWLAASLVLLGVLVTAAVAWQQRCADALLQDPAALEPPEIPGRVCRVSPTVNFGEWSSLPLAAAVGIQDGSRLSRDLSAFAPYTQLRSLTLRGSPEWSADGLKALAGLPRLEVLGLPVNANVTAEHLRTLADVPSLRFLTLHLQRALRGDDVDALAGARGLVSLRLIGGSIDATAMRRLAELPALRVLGLVAVDGCTEDVLVELRALRGLRRVDLQLLGDVPRPTPFELELDDYSLMAAGGHDTAGLTPRVASALAELPALRAVTLTTTHCSAAAIEALPLQLDHFGMLACPHVGPEVFDALARLAHLRRLDLDAADRDTRWPERWVGDSEAAIERAMAAAAPRDEVWQAQVRVLAKVRVTELHYHGAIPGVVRDAIAKLPLVSFTSRAGRQEDLALVAQLPGLRRVVLDDCARTIDDLEPLTRVPNLLELGLGAGRGNPPRFTSEEVRALLPNVTVTARGF